MSTGDFVKDPDNRLYLVEEGWPDHLFFDGHQVEEFRKGETQGVTFDGRMLRFRIANGAAEYKRVDPAPWKPPEPGVPSSHNFFLWAGGKRWDTAFLEPKEGEYGEASDAERR